MYLGGRITLINAVLSATPLRHFTTLVFHIPAWVKNKIDKIRRFLWNMIDTGKRTYHLMAWDQVCKSKKNEGLGVLDLDNMNKALMAKWWWRLLDKPESLVCKILLDKYGLSRGPWAGKHKKCSNLSGF